MTAIFRKPRRLTITVSQHVLERLHRNSDEQGRSLSNYAAFLLESALQAAAHDVSPGECSGIVIPVNSQRSPQPIAVFRPQLGRCLDAHTIAQAKYPVS